MCLCRTTWRATSSWFPLTWAARGKWWQNPQWRDKRERQGSLESTLDMTGCVTSTQGAKMAAQCRTRNCSFPNPNTTSRRKLKNNKSGIWPRQLMKWTTAINETYMRIYYRITNIGLEAIGCRQHLHVKFWKEYPHIYVSEQRVLNQYLSSYKTILYQKRDPAPSRRTSSKRFGVNWILRSTATTYKNLILCVA